MVLICNGSEIVLRCGTCGPRSNTSATNLASLGRPRKPWAGGSPKALEESPVGTIAARNASLYEPLDPAKAVILFADLQAGVIELSTTNELARLRRAVSALAKLAHLFEIPAVVTTAPANDKAPQVTPEIAAALGDLP